MAKKNYFKSGNDADDLMIFLRKHWVVLTIIAFIVIFYNSFRKNGLGAVFDILGGSKGTSGSQVTYSNADRLAGMLYESMRGFGQDVAIIDEVFNTIKDKPSLVRDVIKSFGIRKYLWTGNAGFGFIGYDLNLYGWLKEELNSKDLVKWTKLFTSV